MPKVILDVTGFYFQKEVDVADDASVADVMDAVQSATAGTDAEFTYNAKGDFLDEIKITYKKPPASRQDPKDVKGVGIYMYNDTLNVGINPVLAWQYYVTDKENKLLSGADPVTGRRSIVPFRKSATGSGNEQGTRLLEGYRITWRLVAILTGPNGGNIKLQTALAMNG